ncbi:hypothetical protein J3R30DRAFT_3423227 [Lentinula aciculospora]|uniref:Uncharacterized protein n=1 Tax=Lentinula aciculospora TaxID=153920 RepID=A0A9W9DYX0_9AGAR|nr:hypothetical protein J3R30DRAFT_3423227 [Lentinula aciculospora]
MPCPPTLHQRVEPDDEHDKPMHSQYNINYRQVAAQTSIAAPQPVTTSSSYDYWWPYPPGGVTTTASSPIPSPIVSSTLANSFSVAIPSSMSSLSTDVSLGSTSSLLDSMSTSSSVPTSTSTATTSASQSIIFINATMSSQTPASTFSSYPKNAQNENQSVNSSRSEAYLIPIFVVLGVVLGSVVAWIGWGCITRKPRIRDFDQQKTGRRPRRSELEVGPAYCNSLSERKELLEEPTVSHEEEALAPQSTMFSWRALDANGGKFEEPKCDYLAPPKLPPKNSRSMSVVRSKRQQGLSRAVTSKTATSVSIYSQVGEEEGAYGEDITDRMSFLDEFESDYDPRSPRFADQSSAKTPNSSNSARVISLSRRRPIHSRNDSDSHLEDKGTHIGRPRNLQKDLSRSVTSQTQSSSRTTQTGFRMVEGSPLPPLAVSISGNIQTVGNFSWGNNEPEVRVTPKSQSRGRSNSTRSSDSYTALPVRGSRSRSNSPVKQSTVHRQTNKQRQVSARDRAIEEYYGNSLPQSPPQVTCPKLESSLCFTPTLN